MSALDSKLLGNLTLAYQAHHVLREDSSILPSLHISASQSTLTEQHKRISLYRKLVAASPNTPNLSVILAIPRLRERILSYLGVGSDAGVVIGSMPKNKNESLTSHVSENMEEISSISLAEQDPGMPLQKLEHSRAAFVRSLIKARALEAMLKKKQKESIRLAQFLSEQDNGDRLRLEALCARLHYAKQALSSEDVVISRNVYIAKCSELQKNYLNRGLNSLQKLKQVQTCTAEIRDGLFRQSIEFLEEIFGSSQDHPKGLRVLPLFQQPSPRNLRIKNNCNVDLERPFPVYHGRDSVNSADDEELENILKSFSKESVTCSKRVVELFTTFMSSSVRKSIQSLEKKFVRQKIIVADAEAVQLARDNLIKKWELAGNLMERLALEKDELNLSRAHKAIIEESILDEVRMKIREAHSAEIQQLLANIDRTQLCNKKASDAVRKIQLSIDALKKVTVAEHS